MSKVNLEFEKPLLELEDKIKELKEFMQEKDLDLSEEVQRLETRAERLREEIFANLEPWQILKLARHGGRPTTLDYIELMCDDFLELHGDRNYGEDSALVGGIARIGQQPLTIIGHQKGKDTKDNLRRNFGMAHPEGYRKALRLMEQAEKFGRPIITLINTPGAYPGIGAEERGQAEAIAKNMMEMARLEVPIIVVVTGEGGSGGALGIGLGDRILMQEYTYYSVCSPEACAAILWSDAAEAETAAKALNITAEDLLALGIIEEIVDEPQGGAHQDKSEAAQLLKEAILRNLAEIKSLSVREMLAKRYNKFRQIGEFFEEEQQIKALVQTE
ncbi:acetyl-CoA carboxylase carboxyltransferase subunit alpha [Fuchsiella alkaliacetigena]|uniref:acetyl-CoA carboxylase carboxyltransferase subunit alpha n=1 Tax=Fuchsiella alkaliacetigena TaxID=957042 RepID=UPI00200ACDDC|nr:acetyl-CoA carboxylase carboxyltransferase subunit alpha [Fuchsiella alkaliacetigena]MCK8825770.1 acetyl-CoA carboxylase carboxyltransferase subunit alpha [Fuchsiella alkaliacetigena]